MQEDQTAQNHPTEKDGREAHTVEVDKTKVTTGEDTIFKCIHCDQDIHLIHDGDHFTLRQEDADNPSFGTVSIAYINKE